MDYFRTMYEKCYDTEEYYWGLEPAGFLDELIQITGKKPSELKVLDIGCGEGKDAVYMAELGCKVSAFDITESGIRKTKMLASQRGVEIDAFVADINDLELNEQFDVIYSTGTIQYLFDDRIEPFFQNLKKITNVGGYVYFNVFVDKPFLPLPPDWDKEEKMWKTGQLFTYLADWEVVKMDEIFLDCNSSGVPHVHCMDTVIAKRRV